jgi:hypothetical protein
MSTLGGQAEPLFLREVAIDEKAFGGDIKALALSGRAPEARTKAQELFDLGYRRLDFVRFCQKLGMATGG